MLEELRNKREKLKKIEQPQEIKIHKKIVENVEEFEKLLKETSFEDYYKVIEPYTFKSTFFPLKFEIVKEIYEFGQEFKTKKERKELSENLKKLANRIEKESSEKLNCENGLFLRISTISPKDAVLTQKNFGQNVLKAYETLLEEEKEWKEKGETFLTNEEARRIHALYIASTNTLKVFKGEDGIHLLIESERTQQEFKKMIEKGEKEYPIQLIIREFANFEVEMEFRGFIYTTKINGIEKKQLTGLTQYNNFCYFPKLILKEKQISELISSFVNENIIPNINLENFVIDIVLVKEGEKYKVKIIEVNPFGEFCGGGMFNWDFDFEVLTGKKEFEFRIQREIPKMMTKQISIEWQPFLYPENKDL
jgi:hypothetical protein